MHALREATLSAVRSARRLLRMNKPWCASGRSRAQVLAV
jgi:hypothetical protein